MVIGLTFKNGVRALVASEVETLAISVVNGQTAQEKLPASQESGSALSFAVLVASLAEAMVGVASKLAEVQLEEIANDLLVVGSECLYVAGSMVSVNVAGAVVWPQTMVPLPVNVTS